MNTQPASANSGAPGQPTAAQKQREQQLLDAFFSAAVHMHEYHNHFAGQSSEQVARWLANRLFEAGFLTIETGSQRRIMVYGSTLQPEEEGEEQQPQVLGRMLDP